MREAGRDLWAWVADGAHVYVCGDAKRMAKDVERALVDIVARHGARDTDAAIAFVAELRKPAVSNRTSIEEPHARRGAGSGGRATLAG